MNPIQILIKNDAYVYLSLVVVMVVITLTMIYVLNRNKLLDEKFLPVIEASKEIQLQSTFAHLWLEEIIAGDTLKNINDIIAHIEIAQRSVITVLKRGEFDLIIQDTLLRKEVFLIQKNLNNYKNITIERWENKSISVIGLEIEQKYDEIFYNFHYHASIVEKLIRNYIKKKHNDFYKIQIFLIIISVLLFVITIMIVRKYIISRKKTELELKKQSDEYFSLYEEYKTQNEELFIAKEKAEENEKKLSRLFQKLDLYVKQTPLGVIDWDLNFKARSWNNAAEKIFGFSQKEAIGKHPGELILPSFFKHQADKIWSDLIKTKKGIININENITKQGDVITCEWYNTPLINEQKKVIGVTSLVLDITEQKKTEQALKESEHKYRTIVENISDGLIVVDDKGEYLSVNSAYRKMHGYSLKEIINLKVIDLLHEDNSKSIENYEELIIKNKFLDEEMIGRHKDGSKVFIHVISRVFKFNQNRAILSIVRDITERKKMEQRILKSIIQTEEKERARYAKELHDGLGPIFSTVKLYFQWLAEIEDPYKRKFIIEKGNKNIQEAITTLSEISNNLNPHVLVNYGLSEAVQIFIDKLSENELIKFNYQTELNERFSEEIEITLYRVITELINNTLKYAGATEVIIKLAKKEKKRILKLSYSDNGKGFNMEEVLNKKHGTGIFNIKNRIESVGGDMSILTKPNKGVVVEIKMKLED